VKFLLAKTLLTLLLGLSSVVLRACAVFCVMPLLSLISFKAVFYSDGISQQTSPRGFGDVGLWKHDITDTFEAFANYKSLTVKARFVITCPLYCPHFTAARGTAYDPLVTRIPKVTFAVCNGPDEDTFELDGLNVKFMGIDKDLIGEDSNTQVIMTGKKALGG
jgi:hypothetical protein